MQAIDTRGASLVAAQDKARKLLALIEDHKLVKVGVTEQEVTDQIFELAQQKFGVTQHWHKRIVRTGPNSVLSFKANPENRTIEQNDLVYVDLGPVFDEFEGDIGKTYLLGSDPEKRRLVGDLERIFNSCKLHYRKNPSQTGAMFYQHIVSECGKAGWTYGNNSAGHLVSEFAHIKIYGDLPENKIWANNTKPMDAPGPDGQPRYWILEIHLVDQSQQFGGFYEDLLNL